LLQFFERIEHHLANASGIFDELVVDDGLDRAQTGRSSQRISAIAGRAAAWVAEWLGRHKLVRRRDTAEPEAAAHSLANRHYIGREAALRGRPRCAGAPKSGQDLVGDQQRAEFVRDLAHGANEIVRRNDVAGRALHWLHDDRRNFVLRLVLDNVPQMIGAGQTAGRMLKLPGAAVAVCIGREVHSGRKRSLVVAGTASEKTDHTRRLAVIAAPETDELELLRGGFGEWEGRLNGLGTAGKELDVCDAFRQKIAHEREESCADLGGEAAEGGARKLLADALHIVRVTVTDAADCNAGDEIE